MSRYSEEELKEMALKLKEESVMHTARYRDFLWAMWCATGMHPSYTKAEINKYAEVH